MLKLLLGRACTGKSTRILKTMAARAEERPQLLIVPEQHSHDCERRLCAVAGNSVSLHAEVLSFTRLAGRVFSVAGGTAEPTLDAGGRLLLMDAALHAVSDRLRVYARPSRKPQFLSLLAATVDECKAALLTPERLLEAAEQVEGAAGDKFYDLSLIFSVYEGLCAQRGMDPRDKLTRLAQTLEGCPWARGQDIYLDGFTDFTAQERLVLEQLLSQAHSVTVALTCDRLEGREDDVFAPARRTAHKLMALAGKAGVGCEAEIRTERIPVARGIAQAEEGLFMPSIRPVAGVPQGLELYRALDPWSEVERCAAELSRLCREKGYRWRDLAVTARSMETYGSLIAQIFPRYGVPVFLTRMDDVLQKPILSLVTSALDTVAGGYRYEDLFRYLKTGLTETRTESVDRLENYALKWKLRGSAWTQKKDWDKHPGGYGVKWSDGDREAVKKLDELRRKVVEPLEKLRLTKEKTGRGLALALYSFLEETGLPKRLGVRASELRAEGDMVRAAEYEQLWQILCTALEQCADLLGDTPMDWEEFSRLMKLVLSQYEVGAIPVSLDRVTAGEMPRLAHKHCKVVYILGAEDSLIPAAAPSPGLLGDEERSLLAALGLESAPRLTDKLWREFTILYETCSLPSEGLIVSYPAGGIGGGEKRPSLLVKRLRALFPQLSLLDEGKEGDGFRRAAPRPALEMAGRDPLVAEALEKLPQYAPMVARIREAASRKRGNLTKPTVISLYGNEIPMSASRMDKYKSCHFAYFMQYGLKAKPRKAAGFQAPEYGTFIHYVLQHILQNKTDDAAPTRKQVSQVVETYIKEELGGLEGETPRFRYLFHRLERTVYAVVENVWEELSCSKFTPLAFELGFGGEKGTLPPVTLSENGLTLSITGAVDRVDTWEKDGKLYLRVVDYKTGKKDLDFTDLWNGRSLQMLLYLFTLKNEGGTLLGSKEPIPAGVLYLPAREPLVSGPRNMSDDAIRKRVNAALTRKGLVLNEQDVLNAMETSSDGFRFLPVKTSSKQGLTGDALVTEQQMKKLEGHVKRILKEIAGELAAGNIDADPYWRGEEKNACRYCEYADACQFRDGEGGDRRRWLPNLGADEFWNKL